MLSENQVRGVNALLNQNDAENPTENHHSPPSPVSSCSKQNIMRLQRIKLLSVVISECVCVFYAVFVAAAVVAAAMKMCAHANGKEMPG